MRAQFVAEVVDDIGERPPRRPASSSSGFQASNGEPCFTSRSRPARCAASPVRWVRAISGHQEGEVAKGRAAPSAVPAVGAGASALSSTRERPMSYRMSWLSPPAASKAWWKPWYPASRLTSR